MRVSVETTGSLERKVTIAVPAESFEEKIGERLRSAANQAKLPGFRPGKVPLREVQRRFGKTLRQEVASELVQTSLAEAVRQQDLALAGRATIEILNLAAGGDLEFAATFEVLPEFDLADLAALRVRQPAAEIEEADIDRTVESLREGRMRWNPVERPAAARDRVTVDYVVRADGQVVDEGKDKAVVVGEASTGRYAELVAAVSGMAVDETRAFPLAYREPGDGAGSAAGKAAGGAAEEPADSATGGASAADSAAAAEDAAEATAAEAGEAETGKVDETQQTVAADAPADASASSTADAASAASPATPEPGTDSRDGAPASRQAIGQVTVRAIEEPSLPALDDEFFDGFGVDAGPDRMGKFRTAVRERMQVELDAANRRTGKQEVISALVAAHDFELPKGMVDAETEAERGRYAQVLQNLPPALVEMSRKIAEERVQAQLVVHKIVAQESMRPDDERIRARIDEIADAYEDADGVRNYLYGDEGQLNRIESAVLEDQVVEHVLSRAQVAIEQVPYQAAVSGAPFPKSELDESKFDEEASEAAALPNVKATQTTDEGAAEEDLAEVPAEEKAEITQTAAAPAEPDAQTPPAGADEQAAPAAKEAAATPDARKPGILSSVRRLFGSKQD